MKKKIQSLKSEETLGEIFLDESPVPSHLIWEYGEAVTNLRMPEDTQVKDDTPDSTFP